MKQGKAALISGLIVGAGQILTNRIVAGIVLAVIFYGTIALMLVLWKGVNQAFWGLVGAWFIVWLYNVIDAYKGMSYEKTPCEKSCPANIAPWVYVNLVATRSTQKYPFVPFFNVLAHICPAPCEDVCTRKGIDEPLAIRYLKSGVDVVKPVRVEKKGGKRIAVIGAGPSGLTSAYYLRQKGHNVYVYEREGKPGGVPAALIPEFRLPADVLSADIEALLNVGIELRCGVEVGTTLSVDELLHTHDAVLLATGAWKPTRLGILGEEHALVGIDMLRRIKQGEKPNLGTVGVIGGGNSALDVARCLKRFDNEVTVYYRRRIEDMPAEFENLRGAQDEGITIVPLTTPIKIEKNRVAMGRTESLYGRKGSVKVVEGSEFNVTLDAIILAVGQEPDSRFVEGFVDVDKFGRIPTRHGKTSCRHVFAAGDVVLGSQTVAHAVGQGISVAQQMDWTLRHIPRFVGTLMNPSNMPHIATLPVIEAQRLTIPRRLVSERLKDFKRVEKDSSPDVLRQEACRCLVCPLRYRP